MKNKKVLITGGSGFIGSHLVKKFTDNGNDVVVFDLAEPVYELNSSTKYIKGDIFNTDALSDALKECDTVIHLVGLADSGVAQNYPEKSFLLNVVSLNNVLEVCRKLGDKKIIFPSSAAIYGITEDLPIKENFKPNPTSIYAWHKYLCEELIRGYNQNYNIPYVILRFFNVYGKGNEGVIGIFLEKAKKGEEIISFGPFQYRDFIYAGDLAEALYRSVAYDKAINRTINIGSGKGLQIRDILNIVCEIYPQAKWEEKKAEFTMYDSIADITLAKILLDFEPHDSRDYMKEIIMEEMI